MDVVAETLVDRVSKRRSDDMRDEESKELMVKLIAGDKLMLDSLHRKWFKGVASIIYGRVGNYEVAGMLAQDVFFKIFKEPEKYDPNQSFFTWLYSVSEHIAIDWLRSKIGKNRDISFSDYYSEFGRSIEEIYGSNGSNPLDVLLKKEMGGLLMEAINTVCNDNERESIIYYHYHDLKSKEIGETLGVNSGSVRGYISSGRKKIRKYFISKGYGDGE